MKMHLLLILLTLFPLATAQAETFHFVAHGDTGYNQFEKLVYKQLIVQINQSKPAFTIHVGDTWGSEKATDQAYQTMLHTFSGFNHPLIYTPGDNEWARYLATGQRLFRYA